jgi:hypothetical protein
MTNKVEEAILVRRFGNVTKELTDLVMAAEKAYDLYGKRSIFGRDKGEEADEQLGKAVIRAISRLKETGIISSDELHAEIAGLKSAICQTQAAYPNWPKAYKHLDSWLDEFVKPVDLSPMVAKWIDEMVKGR